MNGVINISLFSKQIRLVNTHFHLTTSLLVFWLLLRSGASGIGGHPGLNLKDTSGDSKPAFKRCICWSSEDTSCLVKTEKKMALDSLVSLPVSSMAVALVISCAKLYFRMVPSTSRAVCSWGHGRQGILCFTWTLLLLKLLLSSVSILPFMFRQYEFVSIRTYENQTEKKNNKKKHRIVFLLDMYFHF